MPAATPEQLDAAERVYYGPHRCELGRTLDVALNARLPGYVDVRYAKSLYLMRPVLSSTGAIRLEDVKGAVLMVQIMSKSMLMDVKAGRRLVDGCVSERHREAMEAAAAAAAAAGPPAASSPDAAGSPDPPPAAASAAR